MKDLQWKKFPVLDDGFVCLVDVMGNDYSVVQAARVSYGKDRRHETVDLAEAENRHIAVALKDRALIRYCMNHRHTSPFEMAEIKLLVRVPMDCWRQWIRHRTASVNEYSTRYSLAIDGAQTTSPGEWRMQATSNKQGSDGLLLPEQGERLTATELVSQALARQVYQERIYRGVAREQARKDLPLSTYTEAYWKINLHNLLHFLGLRMESHAQQEIRQYATVIGEQIVKPLFPDTWQAFLDYRFNALTLSSMEQEALAAREFRPACLQVDYGMSEREVGDYFRKCARLNVLDTQSDPAGEATS